MNKERRKALKEAIDELEEAKAKIESAREIVEYCMDEEEEAYDNLPESMQEGEKGDAMQENTTNMDEAISHMRLTASGAYSTPPASGYSTLT